MVPASIPNTADTALFPQHVGKWIASLPKHAGAGGGLVTIDAAADDAVELMLAALHRDGCVILGNAATREQCDADWE